MRMANRDKAPSAPLVLIANDQEWSARSLESILGPSGYSVVRAYTGQQALERTEPEGGWTVTTPGDSSGDGV